MVPSRRHPHRHLQQRGFRGGAILLHRSIWHLRLPRQRLAEGLLIALAFTLALVGAQTWIAQAWSAEMVAWMQALALPGQLALAPLADGGGLFSLPVPLIDLALPDNGAWQLAAHALALLALWVVAGWLPDAGKPAAYLLRFAALIHGVSVVFFALWPATFIHSTDSHVTSGLRQAWALMLLTPWLHLGTYYLFPFPLWHRVALTSLTLLYLALLTPLQYASHAAVLAALGLVAMPVLHLLFGVMVPILGLVALYGWGMSWYDPAQAAQAMPTDDPRDAHAPAPALRGG